MKTYPVPINSFMAEGKITHVFHNEIAPEIGETIEVQGAGKVVVVHVADSKECFKADKTRAKLAITVNPT